MTPDQQFEIIRDLLLLIGGGLIGLATSLVMYWLEGKREQRRLVLEKGREREQDRERWIQKAVNWAAMGRKESLHRADLREAKLHFVDLGPGGGRKDGADLSYADLRNAFLDFGKLQRTNFLSADLRETILVGADLKGANLQFAKLQGAIMVGADLREAAFGAAQLQGAYLWNAKLEGAILEFARADQDTIWPEGFEVPAGVVMEDQEDKGGTDV